MNSPLPTPDGSPQTASPSRRQLLILIIISGAILLFIAVAILVYLGLRGAGEPATLTPTGEATEQPALTTPASPVPAVRCETIVSSGDVEASLAFPMSLNVGGTAYPVEPIVVQEDAWTYPDDQSGVAVWVCGTVVNYVIGLEPTPTNEALLVGLAPGDDLTLQLTSGATLPFRFSERRDTAPGSADVATQQQPRLTLVLPGAETWQLALADYAADAESVTAPPAGVAASVGEAVEAGLARVTVNQGYMERNVDLVPSTAYYFVVFRVENLGSDPLAAASFSMELRDSLGNTYLLSPDASKVGEAGLLSEEIPPGESRLGTAGYLVPDPLPAGELTWVFSPHTSAGAASVAIPYEGGTQEVEAPVPPEVTLVDAFLDDAGDRLILEGEVWNRSTEALVVESSDISMASSSGVGELTESAPPLPWTIEPGARQVFELQYRKPEASNALLELLGYSFEVGGLN